MGESVAVATTKLRVRMSPTQCCSRHWLLSTISPNAHGSIASRMRMVAAPAVRSVAPRLRDPCASVRAVWALMCCVGHNFLRFAGWERVAFFLLGRVWEVLYDVQRRAFGKSGSWQNVRGSPLFSDSLAFKTSATASSYVFLQQELARGLRLSQPSRVAKDGAWRALGCNYPIASPACLLYTSPSPRDATLSRMPSSA